MVKIFRLTGVKKTRQICQTIMQNTKNKFKHIAYTILPKDLVDIVLIVKRNITDKRVEKEKCKINQTVIQSLLKSEQPIKVELGSGKRPGMEDWNSIDLGSDSDIQIDLSLPLPFPDNCVTKIYSSHLLEHFSYPKPMTDLLEECYRILKPGGVFSVAVPNAKIYLDAYFSSEEFEYKKYCVHDAGLTFKSRIEYVNYIAYMGGHHRHMFDEENLVIILSDVGFKNVRIRQFDPSIDVESRRYETIYAEGIK